MLTAFLLLNTIAMHADSRVSGEYWTQSEGSMDIESLTSPFKEKVKALIEASNKGGLNVEVFKAKRHAITQYCMHWSWRIAREGYSKKDGPPPALESHLNETVDWFWVKPRPTDYTPYSDKFDLPSYKAGALEMVDRWGLIKQPPLTSKFTEGKAVQLHLRREGYDYTITDANGAAIKLVIGKCHHDQNVEWQKLAASYGVYGVKADLLEHSPASGLGGQIYSDDGQW